MNWVDVKNIKAVIEFKTMTAPKIVKGGEYDKDSLMDMSVEALEQLVKDFEDNWRKNNIAEVKRLVDDMFAEYGKENSNVIVLQGCHQDLDFGRNLWDVDDALEYIDFDYEGGEFVCPIEHSHRDDRISRLRALLFDLGLDSLDDHYKNNDYVNTLWYGCYGITADYKVVGFVIRDDGWGCDSWDEIIMEL